MFWAVTPPQATRPSGIKSGKSNDLIDGKLTALESFLETQKVGEQTVWPGDVVLLWNGTYD